MFDRTKGEGATNLSPSSSMTESSRRTPSGWRRQRQGTGIGGIGPRPSGMAADMIKLSVGVHSAARARLRAAYMQSREYGSLRAWPKGSDLAICASVD